MQILELLGPTVQAQNVAPMSEVSKEDAFAKHLEAALNHREAVRKEDADRHASREDVERPDNSNRSESAAAAARDDVREDDSDQDAEEMASGGSEEKPTQSANAENKDANNQQTAAGSAPGVADQASALAGVLASTDSASDGIEILAGSANEDTLIQDGGIGELNLQNTPDANAKTNLNAAFKDNPNSQAAGVVNTNAKPFTEQVDAGTDELAQEAVSEFSFGAASPKTDVTEDATVAIEASSQVAAPLSQAVNTPIKERAQFEARGSSKEINAAVRPSDSTVAPEAQAKLGADGRLEAMRLAQALQDDANADNIFNRFAAGQGAQPNNASQNLAAVNQGAAVAAKAAAENAKSNSSGSQTAATGLERDNAAPIPQKPPVLPAQADPGPVPNSADRAAAALAQAGQSNNASQNAATMAAPRGVEMAAGANNANSSVSTPVSGPAESTAPNSNQAAAAARPTPPPSAPQQPPQVQVALHIAKAVKNGADRISIRLNPAELGRVDVKLDVNQAGQVAATVTVERPETLELLKADARALERALADAGLETDRDNLSFNLRDQNAGNRLAKEGDPAGRPDAEDLGDEEAELADDPDLNAILASARNTAFSDRALDINV